VDKADRTAATVRKASRIGIACRMASRCANINESLLGRDIGEGHPCRPGPSRFRGFYSITNCQKGLRGVSFGNS
jgi:Malonyl-CoA decarboxylase C-terminal domain